MKLTILGATGGVGTLLVRQALDRGHDVTAVVRAPERLPADVRYVRAGFTDADRPVLAGAVAGADAVLSALGPRSNAQAGITSQAIRLVVPELVATGVRRLIVISAAPVPTVPSPARPNPQRHDPSQGFFFNYVLNPIVRKAFLPTYLDLAEMEDLIRDSTLDWTIVRPPRLLDKPLTGRYRTVVGANVAGGRSISRADVAHFMLEALDRPDTVRQAVGIAN